MIEDNFNIEYLHEATNTIWAANRELNEKEKAAFDAAASNEDLINLGHLFRRNIILMDFNSNPIDDMN